MPLTLFPSRPDRPLGDEWLRDKERDTVKLETVDSNLLIRCNAFLLLRVQLKYYWAQARSKPNKELR